ncbi:hypothetical protein L0F63_002509, partial [Massospora cicadina]
MPFLVILTYGLASRDVVRTTPDPEEMADVEIPIVKPNQLPPIIELTLESPDGADLQIRSEQYPMESSLAGNNPIQSETPETPIELFGKKPNDEQVSFTSPESVSEGPQGIEPFESPAQVSPPVGQIISSQSSMVGVALPPTASILDPVHSPAAVNDAASQGQSSHVSITPEVPPAENSFPVQAHETLQDGELVPAQGTIDTAITPTINASPIPIATPDIGIASTQIQPVALTLPNTLPLLPEQTIPTSSVVVATIANSIEIQPSGTITDVALPLSTEESIVTTQPTATEASDLPQTSVIITDETLPASTEESIVTTQPTSAEASNNPNDFSRMVSSVHRTGTSFPSNSYVITYVPYS